MDRQKWRLVTVALSLLLIFTACGTESADPAASSDTGAVIQPEPVASATSGVESALPEPEPEASEPEASTEPSTPAASTEPATPAGERTDYTAYLPNELGRIPVVMFHRFVESFDDVSDKYYTNTFAQLEGLLQTLYERNFRLVPMADFLRGHIDVPAGCKPVVFTFDDGTPSQYSMVEKNGELTVNPRSAAGILLAFAETHPEFGVAGTFYLNMDVNFFSGDGTKEERLRKLLDLGYDIGTHTWGHVDFTKMGDPVAITQAFGKNQQVLSEILPDFQFRTLALPYGSRPKDKALRSYLGEGEFEGVAYRHDGAFAVGAGPSIPVYHAKFDPLYIARVRATGKVAEEADLDWWLENASEKSWYVSDGNPETIVYPAELAEQLVPEKADGLQLIPYEATAP